MDASVQKASDFRNACHNFFNHPQVNVVITAGITVIAAYFAFIAVLHRWAFFPLTPVTDTEESTPFEFFRYAGVIFIVYLVSLISGKVADLAWLKPALGPVIFGVMVRNITHFDDLRILDPQLEETLRLLAFTVVLIRCGLRLNVELIASNWVLPVGLSIISVLVEVTAVILSAHLIFDVPVGVSFILGFLLAATSCSSLLPTMRYFQENNQGAEKSIPALILTSSAIDNTFAICAATILLGIQYSEDYIATAILLSIGKIVLAIVFGAVIGGLLWVFPRRQEAFCHFSRCLSLIVFATAFVFGGLRLNCLYAGAIATLTMTLTAQRVWRLDHEGDSIDDDETIEARWYSRIWHVFAEPMIFVLLGMQLDFAILTWSLFFSGLAIVAIGSLFRAIATFCLTFCNQLNLCEKAFIVLCSVPKGTIQAALGTTLTTLLLTRPDQADSVPIVVSALVCSAAFAGALGHLGVRIFGPFLLHYDFPETVHISNPNHNSYFETAKVDEQGDGIVTFKQYKTMTQMEADRRPYQF